MPPKKKNRGAGNGSARSTRRSRNYSNSHSESEQDPSDDENIFDHVSEDPLKYNYKELCQDPKFDFSDPINAIEPEDLNKEYIEKTGLLTPLHFRCDPRRLGMSMPSADEFGVDQVMQFIGPDRQIEVVEVTTAKGVKMSLNEFIHYYKSPSHERKELYNVLSLEFSLTEMADIIKSPAVVRQIDWVENFWPDHRKMLEVILVKRYKSQLLDITASYPKVQNYCLMSVEECFTDFHIDFGGTAVWYHVLKGGKIFWIIEPTDENLYLYEQWLNGPRQGQRNLAFFGHIVGKCSVVKLEPGDTMIIPSGWIHAVYTPVDSLVFGGNFIHPHSLPMVLKVLQNESKTSITRKYRFPNIDELFFYSVAHMVNMVTGRVYSRPDPIPAPKSRFYYVGKLWLESNQHHKVLQPSDFTAVDESTEGAPPEAVITDGEQDTTLDSTNGTVNDYDMMVMYSDPSLEEEYDEVEEKSESLKKLCPTDGGLQAESCDDTQIFYDACSVLNDFDGRPTAAHRNPPCEDEPEILVDEDVLSARSPEWLIAMEELLNYLQKKKTIFIGKGITRPASLLYAFKRVLEAVRGSLENQGVSLPPTPWARSPRPIKRKSDTISPVKKIQSKNTKFDTVSCGEDTASERSNTMSQEMRFRMNARSVKRKDQREDDRSTMWFYYNKSECDVNGPVLYPSFETEEFVLDPVYFEGVRRDYSTDCKDQTLNTLNTEGLVDLRGDLNFEAESYDDIHETADAKNDTKVNVEKGEYLVDRGDHSKFAEYEDFVEYKPTEMIDTSIISTDGNEQAAMEVSDIDVKLPPLDDSTNDIEVDVVGDLSADPLDELVKSKSAKGSLPKKEKDRVKKEKEREREKEKEKRSNKRKPNVPQKSFEDMLAGPKPKRKHDSKKDKPQFVGGLPMAAVQDEPVVPNPYNYDPKMEMTKLGTGQLQSAYRKTKTNIALPKDRKIYKLEHKHTDELNVTGELHDDVFSEGSISIPAPLTVQTSRRSFDASYAKSPLSGRPSFMPRLSDTEHTATPLNGGEFSRTPMNSGNFEKSGVTGSSPSFSPGANRRQSVSSQWVQPPSQVSNSDGAVVSNVASPSPAPVSRNISARYSDVSPMLNSPWTKDHMSPTATLPKKDQKNDNESWRPQVAVPCDNGSAQIPTINRSSDPRDPRSRDQEPPSVPDLISATDATAALCTINKELEELNAQ